MHGLLVVCPVVSALLTVRRARSCSMWVHLNISYVRLKDCDDELQEHPIFSLQKLIVLSNSGCWPRSEHNDNLWEFIIYSCIGNAKFEIYKEIKITAEEARENFCVHWKKGIPLGYVIKLRNEQQGSWINLHHEGEPDNSSWANWIGM